MTYELSPGFPSQIDALNWNSGSAPYLLINHGELLNISTIISSLITWGREIPNLKTVTSEIEYAKCLGVWHMVGAQLIIVINIIIIDNILF